LTHELLLITEHGQLSAYLVDVEDDEMLQQRTLMWRGWQGANAPLLMGGL